MWRFWYMSKREQQDIDKAIRMAVVSGKVKFGTDYALKQLSTGKAKVVLIARTCPEVVAKKVEKLARLSKTMLYYYPKSAWDLGSAAGRSHKVAVMTILDEGDSPILKIAEAQQETISA